MVPDQRERIQRSRFVCRILNFCVKEPCSRRHFVLARKGGGYMAISRMSKLRSRLRISGRIAEQSFLLGKESVVTKKYTCGNWNPQTEFISVEENREFRGVNADGTNLFRPTVTRKKLEAGSMLTAEIFSYGLSPFVGAV